MEVKNIKKFIELIEDTDIVELNWEKDGVKIGFKRGSAPELSGVKSEELETKDNKAVWSEAKTPLSELNIKKEEKEPKKDKLTTIF